jgi:hypothetical protein
MMSERRETAVDPIVDAARMLRPYLPALVGDDASAVDENLARLIADALHGGDVAEQIVRQLSGRMELRDWMAQALEHDPPQPPGLASAVERDYSGLPGRGEPLPAARFICPYGDFVWYRRAVGERIRDCSTHHVPLVLDAPG